MDLNSSIASFGYSRARPMTAPLPTEAPPQGFSQELAGAARDFVTTLRAGEENAMAAISGSGNPHSLVQALTATELAVETAVTLRDRVVEAYQELLRMPV